MRSENTGQSVVSLRIHPVVSLRIHPVVSLNVSLTVSLTSDAVSFMVSCMVRPGHLVVSLVVIRMVSAMVSLDRH